MIYAKVIFVYHASKMCAHEEVQKLFLSLIFCNHIFLLMKLFFDLLDHFFLELFIYYFYLCFKHSDHRFMIRKLKVYTTVIYVHQRILLRQFVNTLKKNPVTVCRLAVPIVVTGAHMVFVCWCKSYGSFSVIAKETLLHLGCFHKVNKFVIKLQALDITLLDQFHRRLHFKVQQISEIHVTE